MGKFLILLFALAVIVGLDMASSILFLQEESVGVIKSVIGSQPHPVDEMVETFINITNTGGQNITSIQLIDEHNVSFMNFSSASIIPDNVDYVGGVLTWYNLSDTIGVLSSNQSFIIYLNFTPVNQGIVFNNASVQAVLQNSSVLSGQGYTFFTIGDEYEYDGDYRNATVIQTNGVEQFHTFWNNSSGQAEQDWVKFTTTPNNYYIISTKNYSDIDSTDTIIYLYDDNAANLLQQNDDVQAGVVRTSKIVWYSSDGGTFYVKVVNFDSSSNGGNYSISVEKQGRLKPVLNYPIQDIGVVRNSFFNVSASLVCEGGPCRGVSFALDPKKQDVIVLYEKQINRDFEKNGRVNVIIRLKESGSVSSLESAKKLSRGFRIESKEERLLSSVNSFELKRSYETIFRGLSGSVDKQGFEQLLLNDDVEFVQYDRRMEIFLDESVPHVNATGLWSTQIGGINLTGVGQTVCVLDTGINYNHSDFGGANGFPSSKVVGGYDFTNSDGDPWDDHGHGTHVAGIIASEDSTYKGVAPGAKIVAIKVLDNLGQGFESDVISGIEWCVSNKDVYNISVISMSIGTSTFGPNLPCDYDILASSVTQALNNGITVVAASGNEYRGSSVTPGIASPACIGGVISVGSTGRTNDLIQDYSNRDWFLDVLAPGTSIISTNYVGGHTTKTGTSMSTPHVSGVIALMQEHDKLFNKTASPNSVRNRLKLNGVKSVDANTPFSFTSIRAYQAVMQKGIIPNNTGAEPFYTNGSNPVNCGDLLDGESCNMTWWVNATGGEDEWEFFVIAESDVDLNTSAKINITIVGNSPNLIVINPINGSFKNGVSQIFVANLSDDFGVKNVTLYVFNQTDLVNQLSYQYSSNVLNVTFNGSINLVDGVYEWFYGVFDWAGNVFMTNNNTVIIDTTNPVVSFGSDVLSQGSFVSGSSIFVNVSVVELNEEGIIFSLYNSSGVVNITTFFDGSRSIDWRNLVQGVYYFNVSVNDSAGNVNYTQTRVVSLDYTSPFLFLDHPRNEIYYSTSLQLNFTVADSNLDMVWYSLDFGVNNTLGQNISFNVSEGVHVLYLYGNDSAGNMNSTGVNFTVFDYPKIFIDSPSSVQGVSSLQTFLNVSISKSSSVWYDLNNLGNTSLCLNCTNVSIVLNFSGYGDQTIVVFANDSFGNLNSVVLNFSLELDTDGDSVFDSVDFDDDGDGINDSEDALNGNLVNVNTNVQNLGIVVGGSTNLSQMLVGVLTVNFMDGTNSLFDFDFNFSGDDILNLANITVNKQEDVSKGSILVRGVKLQAGRTKTVYVDDLSSQGSVCVKDDDINSIDEVSSDCSGNKEVRLSCPGSFLGYVCTDLGDVYKIEGLNNSGVIETDDEIVEGNNVVQVVIYASGAKKYCLEGFVLEGLECVDIRVEENISVLPVVNESEQEFLVFEKEVKEGEELVLDGRLFDIVLSLNDRSVASSDELSAIVVFKSFGFEHTLVNLTFAIFNELGVEVYRGEDGIIASTENVLKESFKGLDLAEGKYYLVLYAVDESGDVSEFAQSFEILDRKLLSPLTGSVVGGVEKESKWYLGLGVLVLGIGLAPFLLKLKRKKDRDLSDYYK